MNRPLVILEHREYVEPPTARAHYRAWEGGRLREAASQAQLGGWPGCSALHSLTNPFKKARTFHKLRLPLRRRSFLTDKLQASPLRTGARAPRRQGLFR